ncbi:MAG: 3-oxoacyl-ACP reductase family protein [Candidatus Lernaella stagnicola]|nr:3-oxoacyl-ACP reductase family protein [Candidatus Lernaella stagnicola]
MTERRIALVTGASGSIGGACARELARRGYGVGVHYRQKAEHAEAVIAEIQAAGGEAWPLKFDVVDPEAIDSSVRQFIKERGRLDALVAAAGIVRSQMIALTGPAELDELLAVNLRGAYLTAKLASKAMLRNYFGRIVLFGSIVGRRGNAGQSAYAMSKAGLEGLAKSLARELGARQITVNLVAPGMIESSMTKDLTNEQREFILQHVPLQRMGVAEDVAALVGFLCSEEAGYISGTIVPVDGGLGI